MMGALLMLLSNSAKIGPTYLNDEAGLYQAHDGRRLWDIVGVWGWAITQNGIEIRGAGLENSLMVW
jgi:hypothetical protein